MEIFGTVIPHKIINFLYSYLDGFDRGIYLYSDSNDLYNWTAPKELPGGLSGFIRHGTVLKQ